MPSTAVALVFEAAAERRGAVFVHCGVLSVGVRRTLGLPSRFDIRRGNPLALVPVASAFPDVPVVGEHACVRYKSSIGAARRSRTPGRPLTEAWSACHISNAMADRGRPDSHPTGRGTITDGRLTVQAESCHNTGRHDF